MRILAQVKLAKEELQKAKNVIHKNQPKFFDVKK
jgi:hypothetical protein